MNGKEIKLDICPLTGLRVLGRKAEVDYRPHHAYYYKVKHKDKELQLGLCNSVKVLLEKSKAELEHDPLEQEKDFFDANLHIFFGELGKDDFEALFQNLVHWDCTFVNKKGYLQNIGMKEIIEKALTEKKYPVSRKQKVSYILEYIKSKASYDGESVHLGVDFARWRRFYLKGQEELTLYLKEMKSQGLIECNETYSVVSLKFTALDYLESQPTVNHSNIEHEHYDIALSFAGENRDYVEKVASVLKAKGVKVFYDDYEKVKLWGKDLYQHLNEVYRVKCEHCIIFISEAYARKLWTRHELKAAQARAFEENKDYILPVRFDDTEIAGVNSTVGYLDATIYTPEDIANMAIQKIEENKS